MVKIRTNNNRLLLLNDVTTPEIILLSQKRECKGIFVVANVKAFKGIFMEF